MKRIISTLLAVALVFCMIFGVSISVGAKDEQMGMPVSNASEFAAMNPSGTYYLAADIVINTTYPSEFSGTLDGNGRKITVSVPAFEKLSGTVKNLVIEGSIDYSAKSEPVGALAKSLYNAIIKDVVNRAGVIGYNTTYKTGDAVEMGAAGGIAGCSKGNCVFDNVENYGIINGYNTGGIVGIIGFAPLGGQAYFKNCKNYGTIKTDNAVINAAAASATYLKLKENYLGVGGIAGLIYEMSFVSFYGCYNFGEINSSGITVAGGSGALAPTGGIYGVLEYSSRQSSGAASTQYNTVYAENCVNEGNVVGKSQAGGIAGWAGVEGTSATYIGCINNADILSQTTNSGGILGRAAERATLLYNCINNGGINTYGTGQIAGIVGTASPAERLEIYSCTNNADISVTNVNVAGILGAVSNSAADRFVMDDCVNNGNITAAGSGMRAAGIVFSIKSKAHAYIVDCVNNGNISGTNNTAGIVAHRDANPGITIENCENNGKISTNLNSAGGIAGRIESADLKITDCKNTNDVTGPSDTGGILGYTTQPCSIINCNNTANITATGASGSYSGGIVGRINLSAYSKTAKTVVINSHNGGDVFSQGAYAGGIGGYIKCNLEVSACENNGNITAKNPAGGIVGGATWDADFIGCINSGDVMSTDSSAAGIIAYLGSIDIYNPDGYVADGCVNYGTVYSKGSQENPAAGIIGYIENGSATKFPIVSNCIVGGIIKHDGGNAAGLVGYMSGVSEPVAHNNIIYAAFEVAPGHSAVATVWCANTQISTSELKQNYVIKGTVAYYFRQGSGLTAFREDYMFFMTEDELFSGKIAYTANENAGKVYFYQDIAEPQNSPKYPTTDNSAPLVSKVMDGYLNLHQKATFICGTYGNERIYINYYPGSLIELPVVGQVTAWINSEGSVVLPGTTYLPKAGEQPVFRGVSVRFFSSGTASVRMTAGSTGLRFYNHVDMDDFDGLLALGAVISYGTVITPAAFVEEAGEFTIEALERLNKNSQKYLLVEAGGFYEADKIRGEYIIAGSVVNLESSEGKSDHRALDFAAVGYIKIKLGDDEHIVYSSGYAIRNVSQVATAAKTDLLSGYSIDYPYYDSTSGKFSPYSPSQIEIINSFIVN